MLTGNLDEEMSNGFIVRCDVLLPRDCAQLGRIVDLAFTTILYKDLRAMQIILNKHVCLLLLLNSSIDHLEDKVLFNYLDWLGISLVMKIFSIIMNVIHLVELVSRLKDN